MITRVTIENLDEVVKLANCLWPDASKSELKEEFNALICNELALVVLYFKRDDAKAFAQCQIRFEYVEGTSSSPVGYLEGIYVKPNNRKQRIASELLKYCESWSKLKGCQEFASDCELTNLESYQFHLKQGFVEANRIICFKKEL